MSEQKLTTREQLELDLEETKRRLDQSEREVETATRKLEVANKTLDEARDEFKTMVRNIIDISKNSFEAMKHLTTLSAGSIVLLVTFLEKLFSTNREWIALIGIALVCFVVAIICAMFSMTQWAETMTVLIAGKREEIEPREQQQQTTERAAFLTFLIGIICLIIFALKNLY
jgi:hypothetical protein